MQKIRNKKRLTALALVFMLTFLVGSAFAFAPGIIDIRANIRVMNVDELYVVWDDADIGVPIIPLGGAVGDSIINHQAAIVNYRGRTDQRIVWTIWFDAEEWDDLTGADAAILTATARNNATVAADITAIAPFWSHATLTNAQAATLAGDLGLSYTIVFDGLTGTLAAGATSGSLVVMVEWDGTIPATADYGDVWNLMLTIGYDYIPV